MCYQALVNNEAEHGWKPSRMVSLVRRALGAAGFKTESIDSMKDDNTLLHTCYYRIQFRGRADGLHIQSNRGAVFKVELDNFCKKRLIRRNVGETLLQVLLPT